MSLNQARDIPKPTKTQVLIENLSVIMPVAFVGAVNTLVSASAANGLSRNIFLGARRCKVIGCEKHEGFAFEGLGLGSRI